MAGLLLARWLAVLLAGSRVGWLAERSPAGWLRAWMISLSIKGCSCFVLALNMNFTCSTSVLRVVKTLLGRILKVVGQWRGSCLKVARKLF